MFLFRLLYYTLLALGIPFLSACFYLKIAPIESCASSLRPHSIPSTLISAIVAQEDSTFFDHSGVNIRQVYYSAMENYRRGKIVYGASTIDMQTVGECVDVVKSTKEFPWLQKVLEMIFAVALNYVSDKETILGTYIQRVPELNTKTNRGFIRASERFYQKSLLDLSGKEEWNLVLTLRSPGLFNPTRVKDFSKLPDRIKSDLLRAASRQVKIHTEYRDDIDSLFFAEPRKLGESNLSFLGELK